ncbi:MAG TPA: hypothetical protein DEF82_00445 [Crocinitomicaceae bacterium]|nr:hypothetical protein [Crocinitomicaceae bacterium]
MDIQIKNPLNEVKGYELKVSGAKITGVSSLIDVNQFPMELYFDTLTNEIACLSLVDSLIPKYTDFTPILRVYLTDMSNEICLDSVIRILNKQLEPVNIQVANTCVESLSSNVMEQTQSFLIQIYPNPSKDLITITLPKINEAMELNIVDAYGKVVFNHTITNSDELKVKTSSFDAGIYTIQLNADKFSGFKRFIKLN